MSKPKLLITRNDFPKVPLFDVLEEMFDVNVWPSTEKGRIPREEYKKLLKGCSAVLLEPTAPIDKEILDECGENFKVIASYSVGTEHLNLEEIKKKGIRVGSVGDVQSDTMAECNVGLAIAAGRRFPQREASIKSGTWEKKQTIPLSDVGISLIESTVGIVGLGPIGLATAQILKAFKVSKILYTSRSEKPEGTALGAQRVPLNTLLSESDFIFLSTALTKETANMIGANEFKLMKPTAIFVNSGRGGLVDHDALVETLKAKRIAGAALDVMVPEPLPANHPLCQLDNCILQPHTGSSTGKLRETMSTLTAQNLIGGFKGEAMAFEL